MTSGGFWWGTIAMERFRRGVSWCAVLACTLPGLATAQVVLDGGGVTLRAPAALDCAALPVIAVEGAIAAALAGDRAPLADVVARMSLGIASACPTAEALRFEGTDRDVTISFRTEKAQGWRMPGAAVPPPATAQPDAAGASSPAPQPAAPAATAALPTPAPEPPIPPGLAFADLANFYGPIPAVNGHFSVSASEATEAWARVFAARAYAVRPEILNDDELAFLLAAHMLTAPEFDQFLGPVAEQIRSQRDLRYLSSAYQGISVFDRRDLGNRIRTQLKPYLDQRRQTGPIPVVGVLPVYLGEYDFATGSFPITRTQDNTGGQQLGWMNYMLGSPLHAVVFPERLQTSEAEARQLDTFLRERNDTTLYLGVFVTLDPRAPAVISPQMRDASLPPGTVTSVVLYADQALTQPIFDYTATLAEANATAAALAQELARPMTSAEGLLAAIAAKNGTTAALPGLIESVYLTSPEDRALHGPRLAAALAAPPPERIYLRMRADLMMTGGAGSDVDMRTYGADRINFATLQGQPVGGNVEVTPLPAARDFIDDVTFQAMRQRGQTRVEFLVDAVLDSGSLAGGPGRLDLRAILRPQRVTVVSGDPQTRTADRRLLAVIDMPAGPALPTAVVPAVVVTPQGN
jgi:hypothetical protein